jgi:CDP-diacylglycerol--glycerol-3-phosphate 3-phosphatidyltransferase
MAPTSGPAPMNLPNTLTVARIFLVPLLVVVLLTKFPAPELFGLPKEVVAALIFGLAALTDWLDGHLARRRGQVTTLGQLLDPIADKLLITAALVSLVQMSLVPAWMAAVIIGRELAVTGLRSLAQSRGVIMPASSLGKLKMTAQIVAVLTLLVAEGLWRPLMPIGLFALWVSVGIAFVSAADYYRQFVRLATARGGRVTPPGAPSA